MSDSFYGVGKEQIEKEALDLVPTEALIAALERRFDTMLLAGVQVLTQTATDRQEQRFLRKKGHDLVQIGLLQYLAMIVHPNPLQPTTGPMGVEEGSA